MTQQLNNLKALESEPRWKDFGESQNLIWGHFPTFAVIAWVWTVVAVWLGEVEASIENSSLYCLFLPEETAQETADITK